MSNTATRARTAHLVASDAGPMDTGHPGNGCDHEWPHAPYRTTVVTRAATITKLVKLLEPQFGKPDLSTRRAVGEKEVRTAYSNLKRAKKRVRVYSSQGFVPTSYRSAQIQFVEAERDAEGNWVWRIAWGSAGRSHGQGALIVVQ